MSTSNGKTASASEPQCVEDVQGDRRWLSLVFFLHFKTNLYKMELCKTLPVVDSATGDTLTGLDIFGILDKCHTPTENANVFSNLLLKVPNSDKKYLKKARVHIGRNVVQITMKMRIIVRIIQNRHTIYIFTNYSAQHERFISEGAEKEPEVLFLGDSLFQQLGQTDVWSKMFEPLHSLNFSIGGDQTQNLLWRICNGELDNLELKIVVVLIGTNNYTHTAEEIAEGIEEISHTISQKQPQAQIIVMGIPPRGRQPNPLRDKLSRVNELVESAISKMPNCSFLNVDNNLFVHPTTGLINHHDMYDYLHCTKQGYQKLCEPLWEEIQQLMQTYVKVESTSVDTASIAGELASDRTI